MSHTFPYSSLWHYLEETGVLENGTEVELKAVKKKYWKLYHQHYKKMYRDNHREIAIAVPLSEYKELLDRCKALHISVPRYVRSILDISLASETAPIDPLRNELISNVSKVYSEIQNYVRNHVPHTAPRYDLYQSLLSRVEQLETLLINR